jgi:hypothetical protein
MKVFVKVIQICYLTYYAYYLVKLGSNEGPKKEETEWFLVISFVSLVLNMIYFYRKKKAENS